MSEQTAAKVTGAHLARTAYLYVRQSTLRQVLTNTESAARQYALRQKAIALGWDAEAVVTIDTDQGQSGASAADREGFQRLVAEVGMGRAGIVLGLEVSRLARNNADWHRLLEICAMSGTLICDEDGLYDPTDFNDRLLLGLKGTMSEAELHFIRARLIGGQLSKARRGELQMPLPVGLVYDPTGTVVLDPDTGVQQAIRHLFTLFARTGSARATVQQFNADGLLFPVRVRTGAHKGELAWMPLQHWRVLRTLHNPRYAGAFAYGRRRERLAARRQEDLPARAARAVDRADPRRPPRLHRLGPVRDQPKAAAGQRHRTRRRSRRRPRPRGHRAAAGPGDLRALRAPDDGALPHPPRRRSPRLPMQNRCIQDGAARCQAMPGGAVDDAVASLLLDTLTPHALEVALTVQAELDTRAAEADALRRGHVERARHRADLARRRYLAVDPDNRLVADSLEADWNDALRALQTAREDYDRASAAATATLTDELKNRIRSLATDFPALWSNPHTRSETANAWSACSSTTSPCTRPTASTCTSASAADKPTASPSRSHPHPGKPAKPAPTPSPNSIGSSTPTPTPRPPTRSTPPVTAPARTNPSPPASSCTSAASTIYPSHAERLRAQGLLTTTELAQRLTVHPSTIKNWTKSGILNSHKANDKNERLYQPPIAGDPRLTARQGSPLRKRVHTPPTPGGAL